VTVRPVFAATALAFILAVPPAHAAGPIPAAPTPPAGLWHDASLEEYRTHLEDLATMVEACAKARDLKTCDPTLVGPDDRVPLTNTANAERRLVRYGWLRVLLSKAEDKDTPDQSTGKSAVPDKTKAQPVPNPGTKDTPAADDAPPPPPTTTQLLQDAKTRLAHDLAQTDALAAAAPAHPQQRDAMNQVLAGRDFRNLGELNPRETLMEQINDWINRLFENAQKFGARSPWIGRALVGGFILVVCVGLVWGLLQLERRWRIRLVPEDRGPEPGAASARDWQLWLEDARAAAAAGLWREAVHFVYWAAISRLESRRLWPADRARTPREYLALVAPEDPRKARLASLTRSFEFIWYGGRPAAESDYRAAEQLANALISGSTTPVASTGGGSAQ
jgi:Domain of unknown function (DUF4129)